MRAEFKKLVKSKGMWLVGFLVVGFLLFIQLQTFRFQHDLAAELPGLERELANPAPLCGRRCHPDELSSIRQQLEQQVSDHRRSLEVARTALSPMAGPVVAIGFLSSAVGVAVALLLIVGSLGIEFDSRTLRAVLPREPTRWRFLVGKMIAGFGLALAMVIAGAGIFTVANSLFAHWIGLGPGTRISWAALHAPPLWLLLVAPLVVVALTLALGTLASVALRSGFGGLVAVCAFLAVDRLVAATSRFASPFTLSYNVWTLERGFRVWLGSQVNVPTQIWPQVFPRPEGSAAASVAILLLMTALATAAALGVFRRQDIA